MALDRARGAYLEVHIALKAAVLARPRPLQGEQAMRCEPEDQLLAFLEAL
jgi:hypothetical protein